MSAVNPHDNIKFINTKTLFAKIKRDLKSFNAVGIIDEADMYEYAVEVLDMLGLGALQSEKAVIKTENGKCRLPEGFKSLYSAVRCSFEFNSAQRPHVQNKYSFYTDTTYEKFPKNGTTCGGCEICEERTKITVREYIQGIDDIRSFNNVTPLHLSGDVAKFDTSVKNNDSPYAIEISGDYIYANFDDYIYIKYYKTAIDEDTKLPLIPDVVFIIKAIEFYIKYNLFLNWYLNDSIPGGAVQKAGELKKLYEEAFAQAYHERKLPYFSQLVDNIRILRSSKDIYRQIDNNAFYR